MFYRLLITIATFLLCQHTYASSTAYNELFLKACYEKNMPHVQSMMNQIEEKPTELQEIVNFQEFNLYGVGYTPLHVAIMHNSLAMLSLFLVAGANPNVYDLYKVFPLHKTLSDTNNMTMVTKLLQHHAYINTKSNEGDTLLHVILSKDTFDQHEWDAILNLYHNQEYYGINDHGNTDYIPYPNLANEQNGYGQTPLMVAIICNRTICIANLLSLDHINVNLQDLNGKSALHYALAKSRFNVAQQLIQAGADINIIDKHGKKPFDYIPFETAPTIIEKLQNLAHANS